MVDESGDSGPRTLTTVETTFAVIDALRRLEGAGVTAVARELDISKGGAYNHLATLRKQNYVYKRDEEYHLSYRFMLHGEFVRNRSILYTEGKEETRRLASETGEYAHLMTEHGGRGVYVYKKKGDDAIEDEYYEWKQESWDYLHYSATGKAILASLPESRVHDIIDEYGLPEETENTRTTREELLANLETVRDRGFAVNDEEEVRGLRAIGAAIQDPDGVVVGAISISVPTSRMDEKLFTETYPERVKKSASVIELNIAYANRSKEYQPLERVS